MLDFRVWRRREMWHRGLCMEGPVLDELADMLVDQETVDAEEFQELLIRSDVRIAEYV